MDNKQIAEYSLKIKKQYEEYCKNNKKEFDNMQMYYIMLGICFTIKQLTKEGKLS